MTNKIKKQCKVCGKDIFAWPYQKDSKKYCSRKCSLKCTAVKGGWNRGTVGVMKAWNKGLNMCGNGLEKVDKECLNCKRIFKVVTCRKEVAKFCCHKCFSDYRKQMGLLKGCNHPSWGKHMLSTTGSKNVNWKGGVTSESRKQRIMFRKTIQKQVLERDDYTCQICGRRGVELQVDHIQSWAEYIELRFNMDNCRTLCKKCHYEITFNKPIPDEALEWGHNFMSYALKGGY